MPALIQFFATVLTLFALVLPAAGASSPVHVSERISARLITAENGVAPDTKVISAALEVTLQDGWKTYWKSPGTVGYPASVDWSASANLADTEFLWPAPKRFEAFGFENYGYEHAVTFPIKVMVEDPSEALVISGQFNLLVCADLCVPEVFPLTLVLPNGTEIDREAGALIAEASDTVPGTGQDAGLSITSAAHDTNTNRLSVSFSSTQPLQAPMVIPDLGLEASFGAPDVEVTDGGRSATVSFDVLSTPDDVPPLELVVTDGARSAHFIPEVSASVPAAAPAAPNTAGLLWFFLLAFIGGVILNVMPCVLPVLTIKFASVLKSHHQDRARVSAGFAMSALGVLTFMWSLALVLVAIRAGGGSVGWGIQFQSPLFLGFMAAVVTLFAANCFGLFEITLPQRWNTKMASAGGSGLSGDFAIGALAAVLATPCSAPFLGTAVTFALTGTTTQTLVIFTALGLGLALPYLLVAIWPGAVQALPKPGPWMLWVKWIMGALLSATAIWLIWVLYGVVGQLGAAALLVCFAIALVLLAALRQRPMRWAGVATVLAAGITLPLVLPHPSPAVVPSDEKVTWTAFAPDAISGQVREGRVVFVDVTADWCLSCKANKALVLDRAPVADILGSNSVIAMQADWTRADDRILGYLQDNGRYGIPFNIVYGPGAPEGIALPELLTTGIVTEALEKAGG